MEDRNIREEIKSPTLENHPEKHIIITPTKVGAPTVLATVFKYGIVAGLCYIANFFLFRLIGLAQVIELSLINFVILGIVAFFGIRDLKRHRNNVHHMTYPQGWGTSFFIGVLSFGILSLFMFVYLSYLDPGFMKYIEERAPEGLTARPSAVSSILFFHGTALGAIVSLILMQYFREHIRIPGKDDNRKDSPTAPYNKGGMNV